jgi:hypothetical protein
MTYCLDSMAPSDEELMRYALDGELLSDRAKKHLEHCSTCKQRAATYAEINVFFTSKLYRSACPSSTELINYCTPVSLNLLCGDERMRIADHCNICPLCRADIASLRCELSNADLFPAYEPAGLATVLFSSPKAMLRRLVATLQTQRPQFVIRSSDTLNRVGGETPSGINWPKHYKADTLDISLHLSRGSTGELMLLGLFTSTDTQQSTEYFDGCTVELYANRIAKEEQSTQNRHSATPLFTTKIDDLCNIVFKSVPSGNYTMLVHLSDMELTIEGINIDYA